MKRPLFSLGKTLEALELLAFALAAVALVLTGPIIWFVRLWMEKYFVGAVSVLIIWVVSVFTVAFEVRRKAVTAISLGIFLAWLVTLSWIFRDYISALIP